MKYRIYFLTLKRHEKENCIYLTSGKFLARLKFLLRLDLFSSLFLYRYQRICVYCAVINHRAIDCCSKLWNYTRIRQ